MEPFHSPVGPVWPHNSSGGSRPDGPATPNLFDFATSELSQDAFIAWFLSWADPVLRASNEPLHRAATLLLDRLMDACKMPRPVSYESVSVRQQYKKIDVLVVVNGEIAILIEDKTGTADHSDQLVRYIQALLGEFPRDRICPVFLKTGDQCDLTRPQQAGYACFLRSDLLDVLQIGHTYGVRNDIFDDFISYLSGLEAAVQSYCSVPITAWDSDPRRWVGFFTALRERLCDGHWDYVSNPSGGFMGFWWHWKGKKYLQLEQSKLCFKIEVADQDKATRMQQWVEWHEALMTSNQRFGLPLKKPPRREGQWMTVVVMANDYRQIDGRGIIDMDRTVEMLRKAEQLLDAAVGTEGA
jgi:hypothetical protein